MRPCDPRPKRKRPKKAGDVTIAAGFNFNDGILLCADTKHTGSMALYKPKLFPSDYVIGGVSRAKSVFAIVGSDTYAKMAVTKCSEAISRLKQWSLIDMATAIEKVLLQVHKNHVYPHPDRNMVGGPDFWLMVALWSSVDGLRSYKTTQTSIVPFDVYDCAGSGEYLGHYLLKPIYRDRYVDLERAVSIACTALQRIKAYDADCGGNSEFIKLTKSGELGNIARFDISTGEKFAEEFYEQAEILFARLSSLYLPAEEVEDDLSTFRYVVSNAREGLKDEKARHDAFMAMLEGMNSAR